MLRDLVARERVGAAVQHDRVARDLDVEPRLEPEPRDLVLDPRDQRRGSRASRARPSARSRSPRCGSSSRSGGSRRLRRHEDEVRDLLARVGDALLARARRARARGSAASATSTIDSVAETPGSVVERALQRLELAQVRRLAERALVAAAQLHVQRHRADQSLVHRREVAPHVASARRRRSGSRCRRRCSGSDGERDRGRERPAPERPASSGARTRRASHDQRVVEPRAGTPRRAACGSAARRGAAGARAWPGSPPAR